MRFRIPGSDSFPIRFLFHRPCDEIFALSPFYIHTYNINIVCATGECGALAPLSRAGHTVITRPGPRARSSVWGCVLFLTRGEEHLEHLECIINLTSRAGELRSAPSGPDDRDRVTG